MTVAVDTEAFPRGIKLSEWSSEISHIEVRSSQNTTNTAFIKGK